MRHLKGAISDKNGSFLWCFSKISNFRFFIIRSCFYSRVASLFGPSALPLAQGKWLKQHALLYDWYHPARPPVRLILPITPSCMIDITQHSLKGQKLCKLSGFLKLLPIVLKLLPLQGALFATHKNPGRCPGLRASAPSGRAAYIGFLVFRACCLYWLLAFRACCLYWLLGLYGELLIWALNYPIYPSVRLK